jgi:predicted transcriptional regulator
MSSEDSDSDPDREREVADEDADDSGATTDGDLDLAEFDDLAEDADGPPNPKATAKAARERLEAEADRAVEGFDENVVDLLAWLLDTETRARIYVYLRQHPASTSEEVADGTGLYPSTVREALAELHEEGKVTRRKRESAGAGNNPYEYEAIAPSELVNGVVDQVQRQLNAVFNLDRRLGGADGADDESPVTITVEDEERPE